MASDRKAVPSVVKKARVKVGQIPGTRPSIYNNQLLISTGIPSLDSVIGGGLAVGTVLLIEEDVYGSYSRLMLKYFLAEAVLRKHSIFVSSASENTEKLIKELPAPVEGAALPSSTSSFGSSKQGTSAGEEQSEKMKIAWRYQNQQKVQTMPSATQFGHYYDLTRTMDPSLIDEAAIFHGSPVDLADTKDIIISPANMNPHYCRLLNEIREKITAGGFSTSQQAEKRSILRIGIHSLGSPLWGEGGSPEGDPSLTLFLLALRAELRSALACAMITVPTHLFQDRGFVQRVERFCDTVVRIESFSGSEKEKNPVFKDYHGLVHLIQLPRLNSLIPAQLEIPDLAFKLRRKKFTIERLHLPPELADPSDSSGLEKHSYSASGPCGTSSSSKLAF